MKNLWEELENYCASDYYPFHMPGHKRLPQEASLTLHKRLPGGDCYALSKRFPQYEDICKYDITEIEGFDNLHEARGLLLSLQQKAARVYHAEESFFLVNGSTGGILSAVSAVAKEGKRLLVARNCHKSVYNAVLLNRLQTEYLWPERIEEFDIQGEIDIAQLKECLRGGQDICGLVVTSPTYDGILSDIEGIAEAAHERQVPLIVDEAHGSHFALSETAPKSAVECGADIVVGSVHKTLPALTQTALLHVQGKLVDRERLKSYMGIYQSSSPSYLLMASIDACVDFVREQGRECYERLLAFRGRIDERAAGFSCVRIMPAKERRDPGKLVISVKNTGMSGWKLAQVLLEKYHLQMEMAAPSYVLGILTGMDTWEGVERLLSALKEIDEALAKERKKGEKKTWVSMPEKMDGDILENMESAGRIKETGKTDDIYHIRPLPYGLTIYESMQRAKEWVFLEQASGRVSGGFLYFYPPGIPILVPGEIISARMASRIEEGRKAKECIVGISDDGALCVLR